MNIDSGAHAQILRDHPRRRVVMRAILVAAIAACIAAAYGIGVNASSRSAKTSGVERTAALARLAETESALADVRQQVANLEANLEIERAASASVRTELSEAQLQRRRLEQESELYRSLLSGAVRATGLAVEKLEVERASGSSQYRFRLVLLQRAQRHVELSGAVGMTISGTQDGNPRNLSLADVQVPRAGDRLPLQLLYFQIIEGELRLPDGFVAKEIRLDAQVTKGRPQKVSYKRAWIT